MLHGVTKISYASTPNALLTGAEAVLVVAPAAVFKGNKFPKVFSASDTALLRKLGAATAPGDRGASASTLSSGKIGQLMVGVLPNEGSRYNSPSRAAAIHRVVASSGIGRKKKGAVLLILDDAAHVLPACNAIGRALPELSLKSGKKSAKSLRIGAIDKRGKVISIDKSTKETVTSNRIAARLVDTPPTDLNPTAYARVIRATLKGIPNVTIKEIKGDALLKAKLGGIHAVGRCAVEPPRMIIATYAPPRATGKHFALVGKGITYDTGGLHIKGRGGMEGMKADMGGSAAVLGAFRTLTTTKAVRNKVTLIMCLAENAIGPAAYKPDDVITMHSGKTVEINNTDAEGRLLLGDGVSYAARVLKADTIIDAATLTGAQLIATGLLHAAVFSNDAKLEQTAVESGTRSGDLCHPLPFAPEFYKQEFATPLADMRNSVKNRGNAQSSCAAQFIYWHIEDTQAKWLHIDLAGPAFPSNRATGYGVALVAEMIRTLGK